MLEEGEELKCGEIANGQSQNTQQFLSLLGSKTLKKQPMRDSSCNSHINANLDKEDNDLEEAQLLRVISKNILGYDRDEDDKRKRKYRKKTFYK